MPADSRPVVDGGTVDIAQGGGYHLEVCEILDDTLDHVLEMIDVDARDVFADAFYFEAEASSEVFFIANHDIDITSDLTVHLLRLGLATNGFPQAGAIVEVVRNDGAVFFGLLAGL